MQHRISNEKSGKTAYDWKRKFSLDFIIDDDLLKLISYQTAFDMYKIISQSVHSRRHRADTGQGSHPQVPGQGGRPGGRSQCG